MKKEIEKGEFEQKELFKSTAHLEAQFVSEKCGTLSIYIVKCNLNNYFVIMIAPK